MTLRIHKSSTTPSISLKLISIIIHIDTLFVLVHLSIMIGKMDKWTWTNYDLNFFSIFITVVWLL